MREIPQSVNQFIAKYIDAIDVLEILLLIRKEALRDWAPEAVSGALSLDSEAVEARLEQLTAAGVFTSRAAGSTRTYRYDPSTWQLASAVNEFARWYSSRPVDIIALVFSNRAEHPRRL